MTDVPDPAPSPEAQLIEREDREHRRSTDDAHWRAALCEWPDRLGSLCSGRPALLAQVEQVNAYVREQLQNAQAAGARDGNPNLSDLLSGVDPARLDLSLKGLNECIEAALRIGRNTIDLRWKQIRSISATNGIEVPPWLRRPAGRTPVARRRAARKPTTRPPTRVARPTTGDKQAPPYKRSWRPWFPVTGDATTVAREPLADGPSGSTDGGHDTDRVPADRGHRVARWPDEAIVDLEIPVHRPVRHAEPDDTAGNIAAS